MQRPRNRHRSGMTMEQLRFQVCGVGTRQQCPEEAPIGCVLGAKKGLGGQGMSQALGTEDKVSLGQDLERATQV